MGHQDTFETTVSCLHCIYSMFGHSPAVSSASSTWGHSHYPLVVRRTIIPVILLATHLWNPSSTLSMAPVTNQHSLLYNNIDCTAAMYRTPCDRNVAPVFDKTFPTISHRCCDFQRFWYRAVQLLLLYSTVRLR